MRSPDHLWNVFSGQCVFLARAPNPSWTPDSKLGINFRCPNTNSILMFLCQPVQGNASYGTFMVGPLIRYCIRCRHCVNSRLCEPVAGVRPQMCVPSTQQPTRDDVAGRMLPDWTRGAFSVVSPKPASLRARKVPGTYQIPTGKPSHDIMFTRNNIHTD